MHHAAIRSDTGRAPPIEDAPRPAWLRNSILSFLILIFCMGLVAIPYAFDQPIAIWLNQAANKSASLDTLIVALDDDFTYSGVILIALLWYCWFNSTHAVDRARIAIGALLCFPIGMASRTIQHLLPTHPRPVFDTTITFTRPSILGEALNTWNSFPSDHATVFAGLVAVIWTVRPRLGMLAALWMAIVESARIYVGAHYPSDLIGGAALAAGLIWLAQAMPMAAIGQRVDAWRQSRPGLFHGLAFFVCYQIATLFHGARMTGSGLASIWVS